MDETKAKELVDTIIGQIFGFQNPLSLEQVKEKFAFDIRLPHEVKESATGEQTWAQSDTPTKFMKIDKIWQKDPAEWMQPDRTFNSVEDVLDAWNKINAMPTERMIDSLNVGRSDNVYFSENVFHSQDISHSKNVVYCDGVNRGCEYVLACQRSHQLSYCMRVEDGHSCSNSFSVIWSDNIVNSFFINDSRYLQDCMFCSHLMNKQYCVANVQLTKEEYFRVKDIVIRWVLTG